MPTEEEKDALQLHPLRQHGDTHKKEGSDPIFDLADISALNNVIQKTDTAYLLTLTSQGDVSWTDLDINEAGSGLVPEKANAVMLQVAFLDSGFPASDAAFYLTKNGERATKQVQLLRPAANADYQKRTMIVGLDENGILEYRIEASGVDTASVLLTLVGWIEPA